LLVVQIQISIDQLCLYLNNKNKQAIQNCVVETESVWNCATPANYYASLL